MLEPKPSKIAAVGAAAKLWKLYQFGSPRDLVLEDLALALGVIVTEERLDTADARLVRSGKRGLIRIKGDIPERGRKRFAIAHELGHWLLHKEDTQINACTDQDMVAKYKASAPEVEANHFAAELLMPEPVFAPLIRRGRPSLRRISDLADEFDTSLTATACRLADVSDDYCAVVVSENGRIRWWRGSARFEDRFWLDAGSPLSPGTVAASAFRGETIPPGPQEVDWDQWLKADDEADDDVLEDVVRIPRYGQVLSLIYLP